MNHQMNIEYNNKGGSTYTLGKNGTAIGDLLEYIICARRYNNRD